MSKLQKKGVPRHAGDPCPDPGVHQAGAAANSSLYDSNPSLVSQQSVFGPDGRLSSAAAAGSIKYARPQDLPSFPSVGLYESNGSATNANKAASLAAEKGGKLNLWQYQGSEYGHSAANLAVKNPKSPSYGDFGYNEAEKKKALQAATMSYNKGSRGISGIQTPGNPLSDTMSDAGLEASRFTHQHSLGPQMFTEHPVIPVSQDVQKYQDQIRAAAVSMARRMYELERNKPSAKAERGSSIGSNPQQYIGLEEMAKKLAAERLAALDPDGFDAYNDHYGFGRKDKALARQSMSARSMRPQSTPQPPPPTEGRNLEVDSDDEAQAQKVRNQMSGLRGQLADVDAQKRQKDRDNLMAAAERLVKSRLKDMDERVFADTGRAPPSVAKDWEAQARAKASADVAAGQEKRALTSGKVHLGFGRYMDQSEIDAIASARMQPVLDEISETAEKQRQRDEEIRAAEAERKAAEDEEKRRAQNEKDAEKLRQMGEKQKRDEHLAIEKAERDRIKGEQNAEKRRLKEEKQAEKDHIKLHVYNEKQHAKSEKMRLDGEAKTEREAKRLQEQEDRRKREAEGKERQAQLKTEREEQARIKREEDAKLKAEQAEKDAARTAEEKEAAFLKEEEDAKQRLEAGEEERLAGKSETVTATGDRELHHLPSSSGLADDAAEEKTIRPGDQMPPFMKTAEMAALTTIATNNGEVIGETSTPIVKTTTESAPVASSTTATSSSIANEPTETGEAFTEVSKPTDAEMTAASITDRSTSQPLTATSSAASSPQKQSRRKSFFSRFKRSSKLKEEDRAMEHAKASAPVDGPGIVGSKEPVAEDEEPWEPAAGEEVEEAEEAVEPTTTAHHTTAHAASTTAADDAALYNEPSVAGELTPKADKGKEPVYPHHEAEDGRISPLEDDDDTVERGRSVVSETDDDTFEEAMTNQDAASELSVPHAGYTRGHGESSPTRSVSKFQEEL